MTLVMRYLLVSRVERETNNDLKPLSLLGSDWPIGLYNSVKPTRVAARPHSVALSLVLALVRYFVQPWGDVRH